MISDLSGGVAVVTGAGSGIGQAIAVRLAAEGMKVALADVVGTRLSATADLIGPSSPGVLCIETDVSSASSVDVLASSVFDQWGQVDLLVNNAGVFVGGFLWERPAADLEFVLGVNLWGILHGIRAFVPRMIEQGTPGHVVNTCSIAGLLGSPYAGPYGISKFAAFAASETLAADLAAVGSSIGVTALCPGTVATSIATDVDLHRPSSLATEPTDDQAFVNDILVQVTADGIEPAAVAGMVVDAVHDGTFLLLTHEHHAPAIVERAGHLADRRLPPRGDFT